ncbi:MAG: hypothetical protein MRY32_03090 [Rickettsiales bacterium]|nr:hypothetical protein [Rickettsiales bacterium]
MDHKLKKKLIFLRNKKNQRIFQHARIQAAQDAMIKEQEQERLNPDGEDEKTREQKEKDEEVWSAQVIEIRNKLTNKKRRSHERWNRFAGTAGGGARGR